MTETSARRIRETRAVPCPNGCGLRSIVGQQECARVMHCGVTVKAAYPEGQVREPTEPDHTNGSGA